MQSGLVQLSQQSQGAVCPAVVDTVVNAALVVTAESHKHAPPRSHLQSNNSHGQSALVQSTQQLQQEDAEAVDLAESHFPADATKVTAPARIAIGRTLIANNLVNIWNLQKLVCEIDATDEQFDNCKAEETHRRINSAKFRAELAFVDVKADDALECDRSVTLPRPTLEDRMQESCTRTREISESRQRNLSSSFD